MLCSICKKNTAIIFINKQNEEGKTSLEGFCYNCAKEKGINPLEVLAKQSNVLENDPVNLEDMTTQFETIFKDLTENLSNNDISLDSATAIPFNALFNMHEKSEDASHNNTENVSGSSKKVKVDKKVKQKKTKFLDTYGTNLTNKAKNNELDVVIGREKEIRKNYSNFE